MMELGVGVCVMWYVSRIGRESTFDIASASSPRRPPHRQQNHVALFALRRHHRSNSSSIELYCLSLFSPAGRASGYGSS
jgi:hypothetical protein